MSPQLACEPAMVTTNSTALNFIADQLASGATYPRTNVQDVLKRSQFRPTGLKDSKIMLAFHQNEHSFEASRPRCSVFSSQRSEPLKAALSKRRLDKQQRLAARKALWETMSFSRLSILNMEGERFLAVILSTTQCHIIVEAVFMSIN